jgi:methylated-DNA-[protein]-cysteine S-methyltransferase
MTDEPVRRLPPPPDVPFDRESLMAGLRRRAAEADLLDVSYGREDSPVGPLTIFVTPRGVLRITYADDALDAVMDDVAARVSPRILEAPEQTDLARRQLDDYFQGHRRTFELPLDWRLVRGFAGPVLRAAASVPFGQVTTYREVAAAAGSPRAFRAAGTALGSNPIPIVVPCHRVLHSDGGLGGYAGGLERKRYLLRLEGALGA